MKVVSALTGNRVALWDRDPRHPHGEVWVAGDRVVEVALTRRVQEALSQGRIVEVEEAGRPTTVNEILAAVESGELDAAETLAAEKEGDQRVTLIRALEAILEGDDVPVD